MRGELLVSKGRARLFLLPFDPIVDATTSHAQKVAPVIFDSPHSLAPAAYKAIPKSQNLYNDWDIFDETLDDASHRGLHHCPNDLEMLDKHSSNRDGVPGAVCCFDRSNNVHPDASLSPQKSFSTAHSPLNVDHLSTMWTDHTEWCFHLVH